MSIKVNKTDSKLEAKIIKSIRNAQKNWMGQDWQNDSGGCQCSLEQTPVVDSPMSVDDLIDVGHSEKCAFALHAAQQDYYDAVEAAAEVASSLGNSAIGALEAGDMESACDAIDQACKVEAEYGDCPTWGSVRRVLEQVFEKRYSK
jgi:hypothetical protein